MKNSILLYLTITSVLLTIFTYAYFKQLHSHDEILYNNLEKKLNKITYKLTDAEYFSLNKNQKAQDYFNNENVKNPRDYQDLIPIVTNKLLSYNDNLKGNMYVGHEQLGDMKFIINKVKILNNRWIIADFSDGKIWGEVLIKYFIAENSDISFEVMQSILYAD